MGRELSDVVKKDVVKKRYTFNARIKNIDNNTCYKKYLILLT